MSWPAGGLSSGIGLIIAICSACSPFMGVLMIISLLLLLFFEMREEMDGAMKIINIANKPSQASVRIC